MRKTLLAAAFAVAFPAAYAQTQPQPAEPSSRENRLQPASPVPVRTREADLTLFSGSTRVELYGVLAGGYEYYNYGGKSAASRLMTGMSAGNRWGLRGSENLGDGWRAIFVLESRFSLDTGSVQNNDGVYWCGTGQYVPGVASTTGPQCPGANGRPLPLAGPLPPTAAPPVQVGPNTATALLLPARTTV
ncbi:MAG: porin, partial [Betaproteobacteria bacterium]